MTTQPPKRNLSPDSEMWGRWVEDQVRIGEQELLANSQSTNNSLAAVNGSLQQLSNQIVQLQTGPGVLAGAFTEIGPTGTITVPARRITTTVPRPSWANKVTVILTNEAVFIGDPVGGFFASAVAYVRLGNDSTNLASATSTINGDTTRRASSTTTYFGSSAVLNPVSDTPVNNPPTSITAVVDVTHEPMLSTQSIQYRINGLVFWNA